MVFAGSVLGPNLKGFGLWLGLKGFTPNLCFGGFGFCLCLGLVLERLAKVLVLKGTGLGLGEFL